MTSADGRSVTVNGRDLGMVRAVIGRLLFLATEPELCMIYFMIVAAALFCIGAWTIIELAIRTFI